MNLVRIAMRDYYRTRHPESTSAANRSLNSVYVEVPYSAPNGLSLIIRETTDRLCWVQISLKEDCLVNISGDVYSGLTNSDIDHNWSPL